MKLKNLTLDFWLLGSFIHTPWYHDILSVGILAQVTKMSRESFYLFHIIAILVCLSYMAPKRQRRSDVSLRDDSARALFRAHVPLDATPDTLFRLPSTTKGGKSSAWTIVFKSFPINNIFFYICIKMYGFTYLFV